MRSVALLAVLALLAACTGSPESHASSVSYDTASDAGGVDALTDADALAAQAEARFLEVDTRDPATGGSVLVWQVDGGAVTMVEESVDPTGLTVQLPEGSSFSALSSIVMVKASPLTLRMKSKSAPLEVGAYPCSDFEGSVTLDGASSDAASCSLAVTKVYDEALPLEIALLVIPARIAVGTAEAKVGERTVRAGFVLVQRR